LVVGEHNCDLKDFLKNIDNDEFRTQLSLEEFKWIQKRLETHENRYYQILIFCFTGIGLTLGFSDKIDNEIIPFITSALILLCVRTAEGNRRLQSYSSAYLLHKFYKNIDEISFEEAYRELFIKKTKRFKFLKSIWNFLNHSFIILEAINLFVTYYFINDFLQSSWQLSKLTFTGTILLLILLNLLIALNVFLSYSRNSEYWNNKVAEYMKKRSPTDDKLNEQVEV
jgi:hypothetical protein